MRSEIVYRMCRQQMICLRAALLAALEETEKKLK